MQLISKLTKWLFGRPAKPTRPPTCPVCGGRAIAQWKMPCSCGQIHDHYRVCVACGGTAVVPRKVIAGLPVGLAIGTAVHYGQSFRDN